MVKTSTYRIRWQGTFPIVEQLKILDNKRVWQALPRPIAQDLLHGKQWGPEAAPSMTFK